MCWKDKLNKNELKHLKKFGIRTKTQFITARDWQLKLMENCTNTDCSKESLVGCWICKGIAKKLNVCPKI